MDKWEDDSDDDGGSSARMESFSAPSVPDGGVPDLDEFLRLLSNRRRRYALYYLREHDLRDRTALARYVAAELAGTDPEDVADDRVREVETMFVHVDVPMLEESGVVSSDRRTGTLCLDYPSAAVETLLDACAAFDDPNVAGESGDASDGPAKE